MTVTNVHGTTLDRVKAMLQRDLKLGTTAIDDDMPLSGGDLDLDSLDVLLIVTSVEKEFGIKIPNEQVGEAAFLDVRSLAAYIDEQLAATGEATTSKDAQANHEVDLRAKHLSGLPHGEPFRFVTELTELTPDRSAAGTWRVRGDEAFFAGHFPGQPVVPGVLITEALAQLSGMIAPLPATDRPVAGQLAHVDVRFKQAAEPPADIMLQSTLVRTMGTLRTFEVHARIEGKPIATGTLTLHLGDEPSLTQT